MKELHWKDYLITEKIFDVDISTTKIIAEISTLKEIYGLSTDNQSFFYWLKNKIGSLLNDIDSEITDCFAWLEIDKKKNLDWYMYVFDDDEDYFVWLEIKKTYSLEYVLSQENLKWIEIFEKNCVNHVSIKNVKS